VIVVDDVLLIDLLAGTQSAEVAVATQNGVATTFSFYYRLARAIGSSRLEGSLTRRFEALHQDRRHYVVGLLEALPETIVLLAPRDLVPTMSALAAVTSANFLTVELVATAMILEARVLVTTTSGLLDRVCSVAGVELTVLGSGADA
jgi:hypothetical protein